MPSPALLRTAAAGLAALAALAAACSTNPEGPRDARGASAEVEAVRAAARPITGAPGDYDPLLGLVGADTRLAFLGDATHGTHEFYAERGRVTERLVAERGFSGVAIEGDWADAARVNAYVRGVGSDGSAEEALGSFRDFPAWMWRNTDVRDFVAWLRAYNAALPPARRVGFYGIDVQDLFGPIEPVLAYLDAADPATAGRVRALYACLEPFRPDVERYGAAARAGRSCEAQAVGAAAELDRLARSRPADAAAAEAQFSAVRGAHAVAYAEAYFRATYARTANGWNLRDSLMDVTLEAVLGHLGAAAGRPARAAVWAHNSHAGDARQTEMGEAGELNIGQLARQRYGAAAVLAGFFTHRGTVYAAREWGGAGQVRAVTPSLAGSHGAVFHASGVPRFVLPLRGAPAADALARPRLQRAIGVIYRPESERASHYFMARLGRQFDVVAFFDTTRAVTPLAAGVASARSRRGR
jgi:erythromycin esterase-like protein